jgi:hypothetical protein
VNQLVHLLKRPLENHGIRRLGRDVVLVTECDADSCGLHCRCVVDAVADKHGLPESRFGAYQLYLFLGTLRA